MAHAGFLLLASTSTLTTGTPYQSQISSTVIVAASNKVPRRIIVALSPLRDGLGILAAAFPSLQRVLASSNLVATIGVHDEDLVENLPLAQGQSPQRKPSSSRRATRQGSNRSQQCCGLAALRLNRPASTRRSRYHPPVR